MEYYTTCANVTKEHTLQEKNGLTPIQPEGEGWELIATSGNNDVIYWTWQRSPAVVETDCFLTQMQLPLEMVEKGIK